MQKASLLHGADREICCLGSAPLRVTIVIAYDLAPCKIRPREFVSKFLFNETNSNGV